MPVLELLLLRHDGCDGVPLGVTLLAETLRLAICLVVDRGRVSGRVSGCSRCILRCLDCCLCVDDELLQLSSPASAGLVPGVLGIELAEELIELLELSLRELDRSSENYWNRNYRVSFGI